MLQHADFQKYNPFRVPHWRHERARYLVEFPEGPKRASRRRDDRLVFRYRRFLLEYQSLESDEERADLFVKYPDIFYAHMFYTNPDSEWRAILNARILAGLSNEVIAQETSTIPHAIEAYEQLFFNMRDRLNDYYYVVKTIWGRLRSSAREGAEIFTPECRNTCYQLFGYFGGPVVLDTVVSGFRSLPTPQTSSKIDEWFDDVYRTSLKQHVATTAVMMPVTKYIVTELFDLQLRLIESAKEGGPAGTGVQELENMVDKFTQSLQWTTGGTGAKKIPATFQPFIHSAADPRASEMVGLSQGIVDQEMVHAVSIPLSMFTNSDSSGGSN